MNYTRPDGSVCVLRMGSSFAYNDDHSKVIGVILQFTDITKYHEVRQKYYDATTILVALLAVLAIWNFACETWFFLKKPIRSYYMTMLIEVMGFIGSIFVLKKTSVTAADFGLSFKGAGKAILVDSIFTGIIYQKQKTIWGLCIPHYFLVVSLKIILGVGVHM